VIRPEVINFEKSNPMRKIRNKEHSKSNRFMKRIVLLLVLGFGFHLVALAQPTVSFPTDDIDDELTCFPVTVEDFTDIITMSFSVHWDPSVIDFVNVGTPNATMGIDLIDDFDVTMTDNGTLTFSWANNGEPCTNMAPGVTLPDGDVMFEICFTGIGNYGDITELTIDSDPVPIEVTRQGSNCNNIGIIEDPGVISMDVRPLQVVATQEMGNEGDLVCVDFSVTGFDDMTSMQFSLNYDPAILQFDNVIIPQNLPNLASSSFGTPNQPNIDPGNITVAWAFVDLNNPGVTVPDGTSIFQLCFRIIGPCESSTAIEFSNTPTAIEVTNTVVEGFNITFLPVDGSVTVGDCDPTGLPLIADCGDPVDLNDNICVEVTTADFSNISDMEFLMEWNSSILEFTQVQSLATIPNFDLADFNTANVGNGVLGIDWESPGAPHGNLADGSVLFEVCFDVIGLGGNSPITFSGTPAIVQVNNGTNIGINPSNCEVVVNQPDGVTMSITTGEAPPGELVCMDVAVANFVDIVSYQFSLTWDETQLTFSSLENINPTFGAQIPYFNIGGAANGAITFERNDYPDPTTIPDGDIVFQICFMVGEEAVPNNCDNVQIVDLPLEAEAITSTSNGNNVGIFQQGGEVCVLTPDGFYLDVAEVQGELFDTVCVPLTVTAFEDIVNGNFQLSFDPTALTCAGINDLGLIPGGITVDDSNCGVGLIGFNWDSGTGVTLADSTVLFEVCFVLDGPPNACYDITINDDPEPTANTSESDGTIFADDDGEICILDRLFVTDTMIMGISCPGNEDGMICLRTITGTDSLAGTSNLTVLYNWDTNPTQFGNCAENLPAGEITVTIFVLEAPELELEATFTIPDNTNIPTADAGEDAELLCDPSQVLISGTSGGDNVVGQWFDFLGDPVSEPGEESVVVGQTGGYIFVVTNEDGGCEDRDTMFVMSVSDIVADATGPGESFDCQTDELQLSSDGSSTGTDVIYEWTTMDGTIPMGEETNPNPMITSAGTYALIVRDTITGCNDTDTVVVTDESVLPMVEAGDTSEIGCGPAAEVTLTGSGSSPAGQVSYVWFDGDGMMLSDTDTVVVTLPGTYYLETSTPINGCSAIDSVVVEPNTDFPSVDVTASAMEQTCQPETDTISLTATIGNADNYTVLWTASNGGEFVPGTETTEVLEVVTAGTFLVTVTNDDNFCDNTFEIEIGENMVEPVVEAGMADLLTCDDPTVTLDGTGSDVDGVSYEWTFEDDPTVLSDMLTFDAENAGTYFLTVTVDSTGCTAVDSVEVETTPDQPSVTIDGIADITCDQTMISLIANITPADGEYEIQWQLNGNDITDATELMLEVTEPGDYTVIVRNISSGCEDDATAAIDSQQEPPAALAGDDGSIDCNNMMATLDGTGSAVGDTIEYQWMAVVDGETPSPDNELMTDVSTPGTYVLMVTNMTTNCVNTDTVIIADNTAEPEIMTMMPTDLISCTNNSVDVSATLTDLTEADVTIEWTGPEVLSGGTTLNPTVGAGGTYEIMVTIDATGCTATATVEVDESDDVPEAIVESQEVVLPCIGNTVILDGSASVQGDTISYSWEVINGSINLTDDNTSIATADNEGQVNFIVTNTNTGCADTVPVSIVLDTTLVDALAGDDMIGCEMEGSLTGNMPAGTSGMWTTLGGAVITDPSNATTSVTGLGGGENVFVWTLSTDECPEYSSDEVSLFLSVEPEAENDFIELEEGEAVRDINLIANDALNGAQNWSVTILNDPILGKVTDNGDGNVSYEAFGGRFGTDEFVYILCNEDCENQIVCDTATVQIIIPEGELEVPNGITPNGDGTNDELVFDILNNPDADYPDNEIIIFNRWGDIVFEAKPYNNDWNGVNMTGQELPHATYYYILRLNISEGVIIRGDVTILK
jgi:gliding motility-associated-like protein